MNDYVLEEKSAFKMLSWPFYSALDWCSYFGSIAKTASKKIEAFTHSIKFFSTEVAPFLYKSAILSCIEYFFPAWDGTPSSYLDFSDNIKKQLQECWSFTCCLS